MLWYITPNTRSRKWNLHAFPARDANTVEIQAGGRFPAPSPHHPIPGRRLSCRTPFERAGLCYSDEIDAYRSPLSYSLPSPDRSALFFFHLRRQKYRQRHMGNLVLEFLDFVDMLVLVSQDVFEHFACGEIGYLSR